jgi:hypothetical protein
VTVPLSAVEIQVLPNPRLAVHYFLPKVVFGDDPFTDPIEPALPFSLGVQVHNSGAGIAQRMRISSAQPKIVNNEKGLLVEFQLLGSQVGGQATSRSLTVDLGDVGPDGTATARWLMTASLQGEFTGYSATFEHVNGLGQRNLSLLDSVVVHEAVRAVQVDDGGDDGVWDFLVNDTIDEDGLPDVLYASDGLQRPVAAVTDGAGGVRVLSADGPGPGAVPAGTGGAVRRQEHPARRQRMADAPGYPQSRPAGAAGGFRAHL